MNYKYIIHFQADKMMVGEYDMSDRSEAMDYKIITIFGTRPEAIKMCPLVLRLKKNLQIQCKVILTGQHGEMLDQVMNVFGIKEDYNLAIMKQNQTLTGITAEVLQKLEEILVAERPDIVLVHGDTSTSFAAALACFYNRIPVGHVEAGLRTYRMDSPYPEEFNRQAVDLISDLYFAPTRHAAENLLKEGKDKEKIIVTGNTGIDALQTTVQDDYSDANLEWASDARLLLLTAHRRENLGEPMRQMFLGIKRIVEEFSDIKVIYPVHKNPKVRKIAQEILGETERIRLIEPLDVWDFHNYMRRSFLILTDSGGIQEEAPALGKPVLVMRDTTERPEGVEAGTLKLVGTTADRIYEETRKLLSDSKEYRSMSQAVNPYGDGHASGRIEKALLIWLQRILTSSQ